MGGGSVIEKISARDIEGAKEIIREYLRWIAVDLSFQRVEDELAGFPATYEEPEGAFFLARAGEEIAGCVGMKKIGDGICEMKRLYVRDRFKGKGIGAALVERLVEEARAKGYARMRLDTLRKMEAAIGLYRKLGFREIGQYVENPLPGALFMEKDLEGDDR
jgi:putative acetyltransferase